MGDAEERGTRRTAPRPLAGYIDPAWRLRSRGDIGIRRNLAGILGPFLEQRRIELAAMGDTLIIRCHDSASATEIRFLQREIRKTLNASGYPGLERIRVVLGAPAAGAAIPVAQATAQRHIPATARQALQTAAADVRDPGLANALRRLARAGLRKER